MLSYQSHEWLPLNLSFLGNFGHQIPGILIHTYYLLGFNVCGRYLIVLYYQPTKMMKNLDNAAKKKELEDIKAKFNLNKQET